MNAIIFIEILDKMGYFIIKHLFKRLFNCLKIKTIIY